GRATRPETLLPLVLVSSRQAVCQAKWPRQTMTCRCADTRPSSADSQGSHVSRSVTVGLFSGGAHLTPATTLTPRRRCPSPADMLVGWLASPHRQSDSNSTSPLRSPVKIRPVLLPPCAAGARPTITIRGCSSPHPGTGRPQ